MKILNKNLLLNNNINKHLIFYLNSDDPPINNIWYSKVNDGNGGLLNDYVVYNSNDKVYEVNNSGTIKLINGFGDLSENGITIIAVIKNNNFNTKFFHFNHDDLDASRNLFCHLPYKDYIVYFDSSVSYKDSRIMVPLSDLVGVNDNAINRFNSYNFRRYDTISTVGANGTIVTTNNNAVPWTNPNSVLNYGYIVESWTGQIKSFKIYNKMLSESEILNEYLNPGGV